MQTAGQSNKEITKDGGGQERSYCTHVLVVYLLGPVKAVVPQPLGCAPKVQVAGG